MASYYCADGLWGRSGLQPSDVDVAEVYDGYSWLTIKWLEDLRFVSQGEGGPFVEGGRRIALDGELPLNTHGGNLSEGRIHGMGHVAEAVLQLRGECGARQVKDPQVALGCNGAGPMAGAIVFSGT
jgi:acetyl-CoA acetyltransferase